MSTTTAGKGPGIVYRAQNGSGIVRVSMPLDGRSTATVAVLSSEGRNAELELGADEVRVLARTLQKVAAALLASTYSDEVTKS